MKWSVSFPSPELQLRLKVTPNAFPIWFCRSCRRSSLLHFSDGLMKKNLVLPPVWVLHCDCFRLIHYQAPQGGDERGRYETRTAKRKRFRSIRSNCKGLNQGLKYAEIQQNIYSYRIDNIYNCFMLIWYKESKLSKSYVPALRSHGSHELQIESSRKFTRKFTVLNRYWLIAIK